MYLYPIHAHDQMSGPAAWPASYVLLHEFVSALFCLCALIVPCPLCVCVCVASLTASQPDRQTDRQEDRQHQRNRSDNLYVHRHNAQGIDKIKVVSSPSSAHASVRLEREREREREREIKAGMPVRLDSLLCSSWAEALNWSDCGCMVVNAALHIQEASLGSSEASIASDGFL